jgi:2'-5' RNA ligase
LTLELDARSQEYFERLRQEHYPAELNRIGAHVTLFHTLPPVAEARERVAAAAARGRFTMRVSGLRSLGRGVAFSFESADVLALHKELAKSFADGLSRQDQQKFQPHVVVQNKASGEQARALKARLQAGFVPFEVTAVGLGLWEYLGGPWRAAGVFEFQPHDVN